MALLIGTRGEDILRWSASAQLTASLGETFAQRRERQSLHDTAALLRKFQGCLDEELDFERGARRDLEEVLREMATAASPGELYLLHEKGAAAGRRYFARRPSVLAHFETAGQLHDRLLSRLLALAVDGLNAKGEAVVPHALLVSGDRGRGESTLAGGGNRYFLIHPDGTEVDALVRSFASALNHGEALRGASLKHGPLSTWLAWAEGTGKGVREELDEEQGLETLADLAPLCGDHELAYEAMAHAGEILARERKGELLLRVAKRWTTAPLGLGLFGRYRVLREGVHRGEIDLDQVALSPLRGTVRVLALSCGIVATATVDRVRWLLERGELDVELAERCLKAYQSLVQLGVTGLEAQGHYVNPHDLGEEEEQQFRQALDTVHTLQKIGYQKLFGQG